MVLSGVLVSVLECVLVGLFCGVVFALSLRLVLCCFVGVARFLTAFRTGLVTGLSAFCGVF